MEIADFPELALLVQSGLREPLFLTRNGETVAAIVPTGEQDMESMLLSINPRFQEILDRSQKRLETEGGLTGDQVRQQLGLPQQP